MITLTLASPAQTRKLARVLAAQLRPPALVTMRATSARARRHWCARCCARAGARRHHQPVVHPGAELPRPRRRAAAPPRPVPAQPRRRRRPVRLGRLPRPGRAHVRRVAGGRQRRAAAGRPARRAGAPHAAQPQRADARPRRGRPALGRRRSPPERPGAGRPAVARRARSDPRAGDRHDGVLGGALRRRRLRRRRARARSTAPRTRSCCCRSCRALAEAGVGWADVGTVAVGLGPGAFTGLRIGIATARALAQADGAAGLAGVPTLAALALALASAPEAVPVARLVPLVDGRRREVFAAVFEPRAGGGVRLDRGRRGGAGRRPRPRGSAARGHVVVGGRRRRALRRALPATARRPPASSRRRPPWSAGPSPAARPAWSTARTRCCHVRPRAGRDRGARAARLPEAAS